MKTIIVVALVLTVTATLAKLSDHSAQREASPGFGIGKKDRGHDVGMHRFVRSIAGPSTPKKNNGPDVVEDILEFVQGRFIAVHGFMKKVPLLGRIVNRVVKFASEIKGKVEGFLVSLSPVKVIYV